MITYCIHVSQFPQVLELHKSNLITLNSIIYRMFQNISYSFDYE